ncbi:hypothetical protein BGZ82_006851 [Podila clonocystis]|nr:hypothetical protein BGZ82_006851 [Podila clonocystis]
MGNVSSADHEKVNELLTKRALKKAHKKQLQQQRQQQQQLQVQQLQVQQQQDARTSSIQTYSYYDDYHPAVSPSAKSPERPLLNNSNNSNFQPNLPISQADFYSHGSNGFTPSPNGHLKNIMDFFPTSPSSTSTATSDAFPGSRTDDRPDISPLPRINHNHSSPIIIRTHHGTNSMDDTVYTKSPSPPAYVPSRRGSEHHAIYHQQQQERSADLRLGSSPEAKNWLRQKPTRSSHMIHQYNFQSHQYYQQPGSGIKIVDKTCRNMAGYAMVPTFQTTSNVKDGPGKTEASRSSETNGSKPQPISNPDLYQRRIAKQTYMSAPIPSIRTDVDLQRDTPSLPTPASTPSQTNFDGFQSSDSYNELENALPSSPKRKDRQAGRLVMSRSKLTSPLAVVPPTYSVPNITSPTAGGEAIKTDEEQGSSSPYRPSSTLSSLRSLLGNHPQGLSLIESLEEDDEDDLESLSDTETGDSEAELAQRIQSMTTQKGQHALWKYIGGGNSHAPLRYDIDRILDSGCGLGEWTMEMAKEFPNATVYGIDINPELFPNVREPVPSNCLFTQSNLLNRLSFPDKYFDFVFQRFLYLGLTVDDWPVALKELRRVMKPGAWIELFEPCMRVHRAGPRTREVMRWISRLLQEERGLDFDFAGEKMKQLCSQELGFTNVRLERLSIPVGNWGGRVGQAMAENMVLIFQNLQSALSMDDPSSPTARPGTSASPPDSKAQRAFELMVQSWVRECEENKSYLDYYILVAQKAP